MKEQIETALTRRTFVSGDSDKVRKTATGHSCKTLPTRRRKDRDNKNDKENGLRIINEMTMNDLVFSDS